MEAKELRIGNYVTENDRLIHIHDGFGIDHAYNFEPIPLTEEWLMKFGFDKVGGSIYKDIGSIEIGITGNKRFYIQIRSENVTLEIKYVHQLQNLFFALTGEELTSIATPTI